MSADVKLGEWLEDVKPGYNDKFSVALQGYGVETGADLVELQDEAPEDLKGLLTSAGAKPMDLIKIKKAIARTKDFVEGDKVLVPHSLPCVTHEGVCTEAVE